MKLTVVISDKTSRMRTN